MCLGTTGVIIAVHDESGVPMALVDTSMDTGSVRTMSACLLTCPEAGVGATVLVHSGYVLRTLDPREEPS
jgi:hydrogenase maturation factor